MKRSKLKTFQGKRVQGKGKIERFGCAKGSDGSLVTILIVDTYLSDGEKTEYIDHCWVKLNKKVIEKGLNLKQEDYISFTSRVDIYYRAPDYERVQGYKIHKINDISVSRESNGIKLKEFIDNMKDIGKIFSPEYEVIV